jgi:hypothetical protein
MPRRAARGPSRTPRSPQQRAVRCQAAQRVADQALLRGSLVRMRRTCGKKEEELPLSAGAEASGPASGHPLRRAAGDDLSPARPGGDDPLLGQMLRQIIYQLKRNKALTESLFAQQTPEQWSAGHCRVPRGVAGAAHPRPVIRRPAACPPPDLVAAAPLRPGQSPLPIVQSPIITPLRENAPRQPVCPRQLVNRAPQRSSVARFRLRVTRLRNCWCPSPEG